MSNHLPANDNGSGVCLHSGSVMWEPVVIFAIDAAAGTMDERQRALGVQQFKLWCARLALPVKELVGSYKGEREPSFLMTEADFEDSGVRFIWCSGQESLLRLTATKGPAEFGAGYRFAWLDFTSPARHVELGRFRRVNASDLPAYDGWTFEPEDGMGGGGYWAAGEPRQLPAFGTWEAEPDPKAPSLANDYVPSDPYGERFG